MATTVIKKDGSKQPFDEGKLRKAIEMAAQDAQLSPERAVEVVDVVMPAVLEIAGAKEEIATSELRDAALAELDKVEPAAAEAWRKHNEAKNA